MNQPEIFPALDLTSETATANTKLAVNAQDYDPRPHEDNARRNIAYGLIALLWAIVLGIFLLLLIGTLAVGDIKEFGVVLGPVVALVSAATGFYYGTKSPSKTR